MKKNFSFVVLLGFFSFKTFSQEQSSTSMVLNAYVEASCEVVSTDSIAFGTYDPVGVNAQLPLRASGSISVRCTNGTSNVQIALGQGGNAQSGSTCERPLRRMGNASGNMLQYVIFQDITETQIWGCSDTNKRLLPPFTSLTPVSVYTYGVVPSSQDVSEGQYRDNVEVSVTF